VKKILFATTNPHKKERFQAYFRSLGLNVLSFSDLNININIKEEGRTPEENAKIKAMAGFKASKIPTFAVDYGLYIDKFSDDMQPGLNIRRIHKDERAVSDEEMLDHFVRELEKVGGKSKGNWISAIALVTDNKFFSESFSGWSFFTARKSPKMTPGEPLNSIQVDPKSGKYFTDLTKKEWINLQEAREKGYIKFMKKHLKRINP